MRPWRFPAMPVPNPVLLVDSDNQKVQFLMILGRPKKVFYNFIVFQANYQ